MNNNLNENSNKTSANTANAANTVSSATSENSTKAEAKTLLQNKQKSPFLSELSAKYRGKIVLITVLSLAVSVCSLAFAYITKFIVNSAASADGGKTVAFIIAAVAFLLFKIVLKCVSNYSSEKTASKIFTYLRQRVFNSLIHLDYQKLSTYHSGELINRLSSDVAEIAQDLTHVAPTVASIAVQLIGTAALLFTIDYRFALIFLAGALVAAGVVGVYRVKIKAYRKAVLEKEGLSRSFMQDNLTSAVTVKAYNAEKNVANRSKKLLNELYLARLARAKLSAFTGGIYSCIGNLGLIFAIVYFGAGLLSGADYGSVTAVILLLLNVQQPISGITAVISALYSQGVSAERLCEIIGEVSVCRKTVDLKNDGLSFENLSVNDVCFAYDSSEQKIVLSGANLQINRGEKICVVGASGSGKSTLIKLMLGVYKPKSGCVSVEVKNALGEVARLSPEQISGLFAYVPQGNFLLAGTVKENLCFFAEDRASETGIDNEINAACAQFVYDLPNGLNTVLGERGGGLSEGQIQRLAIARALVCDRPFILLDEATSALDEATERAVIKNLCTMQNKTCVFITHRKAALDYIGSVYAADGGTIKKITDGDIKNEN